IDVSEMSVEETADLLEQLAEPIDGAHGHGIAHRDVKPANIMVVRNNDKPFYKLGDFGTAKYFGEGLVGLSPPKQTSENTLVGSPAYMSPEYVSGAPIVSGHIDLWALAVTAYEALTRTLPFDGELWTHVAMALLKGEFKPPSQVVPGLPVALDAVFKRAFAADPQDRFQSARALAVAFREAITARPILPVEPLLRRGSAPELTASPAPQLEDAMTPGPMSEPIALIESLPPAPPRRKPFGLMLGAGAVGAVAIGLFAWLALRPEATPSEQPAAPVPAVEPTAPPTATAQALSPPSALPTEDAVTTATASTPIASAKGKRPPVAPKQATKPTVAAPTTTPASTGKSPSKSETH
ncbi:MAG: protein kinase, partial [Myxococcales bacterium]|nr:protein kinase [Myxococcales bacterium]